MPENDIDRSSSKLYLQPITEAEANAFIERHHNTHDPDQGWKFGVAVNDGENVVGVAKVGRPRSKHRDDGLTLEVTRCATDGTENAASKLYAAAWRAAKNMGYHRLITYTLADSERGWPLKVIEGWEVLHERTGGGDWDSPSRPRVDTSPDEQKTLWENTRDDAPSIEIEVPSDDDGDDTEQEQLLSDGGNVENETNRSENECPECGTEGIENPVLDDWYECNRCVLSFSADGEAER